MLDDLKHTMARYRMKPIISIVIPTYNRREYLSKCIRALLGQTAGKDTFEIIIVDDGSTDDTYEYILALKKKITHPRIIYFKQENSGPAMARNNGARHARGKYLAFTDSDCEPTKDWIKNILEGFRSTDADSIIGFSRNIHKDRLFQHIDDLALQKELTGKSIIPIKGAYPGQIISTNDLAIRKDVFFEAGGFDESFCKAAGEDLDFGYKLAAMRKKNLRMTNVLVKHYQRDNIFGIMRRFYQFGIMDAKTYKRNFHKHIFLGGIPIKKEIYARFPLTMCIRIDTPKMMIAAIILALFNPWLALIPLGILIAGKLMLKNPYTIISSLYTDLIMQSASFAGTVVGSIKYGVWCT